MVALVTGKGEDGSAKTMVILSWIFLAKLVVRNGATSNGKVGKREGKRV